MMILKAATNKLVGWALTHPVEFGNLASSFIFLGVLIGLAALL